MNRGITLLELLVVVGVVGMLSVVGISSFSRFRRNAALDAAKQDIITALFEARSLTLSSKNATTYGVHFQTDMVIRFAGTVYATGTATSTRAFYEFSPLVRLVDLTLTGGGSDVYFTRLSGQASKTGTVVVGVYNDTARSTTTISASGIIE